MPEEKSAVKSIVVGILISVLAAIIIFFLINNLLEPKFKNVHAAIDFPKNKSKVTDPIEASGTAKNIPQGHCLWIGVKIDENIWPKAKIILDEDNNWKASIHHSSDDPFALIIFIVDNEGENIIDNWFTRSKSEGDWSGKSLEDFKAIRTLCTVSDLYN